MPEIMKKSLKPLLLGSRSSMLVPLESTSAVLVTISSMSVSICNHCHARRVNSSKITILGVRLFGALVQEESSHPLAQNWVATK